MTNNKISRRPSLKLAWPAGMRFLCSAGYGPTQGSSYHDDVHNAFYALDFDKPWRGNIMPIISILAAADGEVVVIGTDEDHPLGFFVTLNHGGGYETLYAHLQDRPVASGLVKRGQHLGYLGESGQAEGPHLHFQLFYRGRCTQDVWQSCPEPISGHRGIQKGRWYRSNNSIKRGIT